MPFKRATPEEKEAQARVKAEEKENWARHKATEARKREIEKMRSDFFASPAGRAREAFERGDMVFQYSIDVLQTQAVVVRMTGAYAKAKSTNDPTDILNSVCHEGWEIVNGSFVFLQLGSESRDKFMASGQQIAVKGTIVGYYLFRRCEPNKKESADPWDAELIAVPQAALD